MGNSDEGGHKHRHNSVQDFYHKLDYGQTISEAVREGKVGADTWGEFAHKMGHHARHANPLLAEEASVAGGLSTAATAVTAPLAIAGGTFEMIQAGKHGADAYRRDDWRGMGEAGVDGLTGAATAGSGVAGMLGLFGVGAAAAAAPILGAAASGVGIGKYGSDAVKELGWLKDDDGKALTPSEWATDQGLAVNDWVEEKTNGLSGRNGKLNSLASLPGATGMLFAAGRDAGLLQTLGSSIVGGGAAVAGAGVKGAKKLGQTVWDEGMVSDIMMNPEKHKAQDRAAHRSPADIVMDHAAKYGPANDSDTAQHRSPADIVMQHAAKYGPHK